MSIPIDAFTRLTGYILAKTVTIRVEGSQDRVDEYLFAIDRWVRSFASGF